MRTSIDFPDELFRHLKASAALQGLSLRDHVLTLIERGMQPGAAASGAPNDPKPVPSIPTLPAHYQINLPPELLSNAGINEFLDRQELENYLNVVKHGRSSGPLPGHLTGNKP
jgi:hypothetical protein